MLKFSQSGSEIFEVYNYYAAMIGVVMKNFFIAITAFALVFTPCHLAFGKQAPVKDSYGFATETGSIISKARRCEFNTDMVEKRTEIAITAIATAKKEDISKALDLYQIALQKQSKKKKDCIEVKNEYNLLIKILASGGF